MKSPRFLMLIAALLLALTLPPAQGSDGELTLSLGKTFGFAMGGRIQGTFSIRARGPQDILRVAFYLDDQLLAVDEEAPFEAHFSTSDFSLGAHNLSAVATLSSGAELRSQERQVTFISADAAASETSKIVIPLVAGVLLLSLAGGLATWLSSRRHPAFRPGEYGPLGGAICPRCGLPFSRHFFTIRLLLKRLERCPHCGKFVLVGRASAEELQAAEKRLLGGVGSTEAPAADQATDMRRMIDDSRFEDQG
jgi:hypothetical protein